jgi:hypothetical protein
VLDRLNWKGIVFGGIAAGIVMNVMDGVTNGILMFDEFRANTTRLGLSPAAATSPLGLATWVSLDFLFGIILVWLYAAMRPRYGPGPATALRSALAVYLPTTGIIAGFTVLGFLTGPLLIKMAFAGALTLAAGALLGARLYRENSRPV